MSSEDVLCGSKRTAPETDETREEHESSDPKDALERIRVLRGELRKRRKLYAELQIAGEQCDIDDAKRSIDRLQRKRKIEIDRAYRAHHASLIQIEKRDPGQVSPGKSSKYLFLVSTYFMQGLQAVDQTQRREACDCTERGA